MFTFSAGGTAIGDEGVPGGGPGNPTPPVTFDALWGNVVLLTRLSETLTDRSISNHTLSGGGASAVVDGTDFRFGVASWSLGAASTGYVSAVDSADFDFGAGDFAVECWGYFDADPGATDDSYFVSQWDETGDQRGWALALRNDTVSWRYSTNGQSGTVVELSAAWTPTNGQWYHVVVTRTAGITRILVDGLILAVGADAATYHNSTAALRIGTPVDTGDGNFQRNIDEVRITKGAARHA